MGSLTSRSEDYLLKEAEQLRDRYADGVAEMGVLERYALVSTGMIWSWALTHQDAPYVVFLAWMPLVLQVFFGIRVWGIFQDIVWTRRYLAEVETTIGLPQTLGWGHRGTEPRRRLRIVTGFGFWIALTTLTCAIALWWPAR
jgi:hypothetical protein